MAGLINMKKSTKGFYTVEAAIFLPLVILAVLSLGYFMRVEGTWENCIHGAVDESALAASRSYDGINAASAGAAVSRRINDDNSSLTTMRIYNLKTMYSDLYLNNLTSFRIYAAMDLDLPLGFSREFTLDYGIKYRAFVGAVNKGSPMGVAGLETYCAQQPVWVFPHSGEKYHSESCTYVKASASPAVLTAKVKKKYDSCRLCRSDEVTAGSIVFCFEGEGTSYHRGTCGTIVRHTAVIDKSEAEKKGYRPCTKCGGG